MTLYKYRALNDWSLDTLRSSKFWFSSPTNLNDTFEFSLSIFIQLTPTQLVEYYEERFKIGYVAQKTLAEMMKHSGSYNFTASKEFIRSFINSNHKNQSLYYISMVHYLRYRGLSTEYIVTKLNLQSDNSLLAQLEQELRETYSYNHAAGRNFGVLSLSELCNDVLMWAHYADSCSGICIGLTVDAKELFNEGYIFLMLNTQRNFQFLIQIVSLITNLKML